MTYRTCPNLRLFRTVPIRLKFMKPGTWWSKLREQTSTRLTASLSPISTNLQNGSNRTQVHEARNIVIKTQKTNIHKINSILESNSNKVQTCKVKRRAKYKVMRYTIAASEYLRNKSLNDLMIQFFFSVSSIITWTNLQRTFMNVLQRHSSELN